jgi:hypothetical protein
MSNPYSADDIDTQTKWNALLVSCCCEMPECPAPEIESESVEATADALYDTESEPEIVDDEYYGGFATFVDPGGADTEKLPLIYRKADPESGLLSVGEWGSWEQFPGIAIEVDPEVYPNGAPGDEPVVFSKTKHVYDSEGVGTATYSGVAHMFHDFGEGPVSDYCTTWSNSTTAFPFTGEELTDIAFDPCERTATKWTQITSRQQAQFGTEESRSCPLTYGDEVALTYWADIIVTDREEVTISDSISPAAVITAAIAALGAWPTPATGGTSMATTTVDWPTLGDIRDETSAWPGCDALPITVQGGATVTKVRRRFNIPAEQAGTYRRVLFDILEEPDGWDAVPPTASRSFYAQDQEWVWNSPAARTSPWYEIPPPSVAGRRRMVNIRVWSHAGPYGALPTLVGDQVSLPD